MGRGVHLQMFHYITFVFSQSCFASIKFSENKAQLNLLPLSYCCTAVMRQRLATVFNENTLFHPMIHVLRYERFLVNPLPISTDAYIWI